MAAPMHSNFQEMNEPGDRQHSKLRSYSYHDDYSDSMARTLEQARHPVKRATSFRECTVNFNLDAERKVGRERRLSEHGRHLLQEFFSAAGDAGETKALELLEVPEDNPVIIEQRLQQANANKNKNTNNSTSVKTQNLRISKPMNYFDSLASPRSEVDEEFKNSGENDNGFSTFSFPVSSCPEDEHGHGWETISKKKRNDKPKRNTPRECDVEEANEALADLPDISDLQLLESDILDGRTWGRDSKARHFKAVEKRNYAINKRRAQKGRR